MTEIARARLTSDLASVDLAKVYAENELLKHLSVPRVRPSRIDVKVPLVIESLKMDQVANFQKLGVRENMNLLGQRMAEVFLKHFQVRFSKEESKNIAARIRIGIEAISLTSNYHEGKIMFEQFTEEIFAYALNLKDIPKLQDFNERLDQSLGEVRSQFMSQFEALVQADSAKLSAILVNPETAAVRAAHSTDSVFVLNLTLMEEGVELVNVQDSEGNTKKRLVIE
jgi:hypothetical protein